MFMQIENQLNPNHQAKVSVLIPIGYMQPTLDSCNYSSNNLFSFLKNCLPTEVITDAFRKYNVGNFNFWKGATAYWLVNEQDNITHCKLTLHNRHSGKVVGPGNTVEVYNPELKFFEFVTAEKYCAFLYNDFDEFTNKLKLNACFFGSHLINKTHKQPVLLVENESSALIGSIFIPSLTWIAVGSAKFDSVTNLKIFKNKEVFVLPNYGGFSKQLSKINVWSKKIKEVQQLLPTCKIKILDILESALSKRKRMNQTPGEMLLLKNKLLIEGFERKGFTVKTFEK
jgi:hypothetical protein